jgi:beta-RFAP synthase
MLAFGEGHRRQFGGVGLMVAEPRLRLAVCAAGAFTCMGPHNQRASRIAQQVAERWLGGNLPKCELTIESAPREHVGLGLGTQLSLSVGVALMQFCKVRDRPSPAELAAGLGRARRSSVGTHGFAHGGLVVEAGHAPGELIGPLVDRVELPESWRVLVIIPREAGGLSGAREAAVFGELPSVPHEVTERLTLEIRRKLLPAARVGDFDAFAHSVYCFGRTAGEAFAAAQGGPYSRAAGTLVARLRQIGALGVGQSSWGPSVFALAPDEATASALAEQLTQEPFARDAEIVVTRPDNRGAVLS